MQGDRHQVVEEHDGDAVMAGNGSGSGRSAQEKEKTKMRERQRRSITTKIFHGLRKHGGYRLSSRADINEVLRELAKEAGWIVEPDGTTYRSSAPSSLLSAPDLCPLCGTGKSGTPTPASSVIICGEGDCSTAASPHPVPVADPMAGISGTGGLYNRTGPPNPYYGRDGENLLSIYMYQRLAGGFIPPSAVVSGGGNPSAVTAGYQQLMCLQEARASNQNTPMASPRR